MARYLLYYSQLHPRLTSHSPTAQRKWGHWWFACLQR